MIIRINYLIIVINRMLAKLTEISKLNIKSSKLEIERKKMVMFFMIIVVRQSYYRLSLWENTWCL